ncbi:hypothetical protein NX794_05065 [Streptomyces sp. LP11]|uniref:ABC transporter permease n=1 Tax=Streptomyces pyxinicus TaxID=2970331 RepID=A0ABT2AWI2_9ACTN|nr:hypothetical protein [Streptomyces sp. LP11]MCS0600604.1 hypothetical protein [Streptomyces sp. LP11]
MTTLAPVRRPAVRRTVLRLHRPALLVWSVSLLAALAELLCLQLSAVPRDRACRQAGHVCSYTLFDDPNLVMNVLGEVLTYAPCAVAAWAAGALIGHELESGTARLVWTQAATPARWLAAKLTLAALPLAVGGALLAWLYDRVWTGSRDVLVTNWIWDRVFVPRGPLLPALLLLGLAVGVLAGLALRRTLPALAASVGAMLLVRMNLRELWQPLRGTLSGFRHLHLTATGIVLALTALTVAAAFAVLRRATA